jgi:hypothetical protein
MLARPLQRQAAGLHLVILNDFEPTGGGTILGL